MTREELLLTQEEGEAAIQKWKNEDWALREIRLGRGHWEDIVPVLAEAQVDKFIRLGGCLRVRGTYGTLSRYEEIE